MPYDPNFPVNGTPIRASEVRGQFQGLKTLIDNIPAGPQGPAGPAGGTGQQGPAGAQGEQGLPFAAAVVDSVSTLPPGDAASVSSSFDGTTVHLAFAIPAGAQGQPGPAGDPGPTGDQGPPGASGEVTTAQMNDAISAAVSSAIGTTAQNPASFPAFTGSFSDPPTQAEMMAFAGYVESLRVALAR